MTANASLPRLPLFPERFGGSHLGSARFRAIVGVAADVLQAIDDLDADGARAGKGKGTGKGKGKGKKR